MPFAHEPRFPALARPQPVDRFAHPRRTVGKIASPSPKRLPEAEFPPFHDTGLRSDYRNSARPEAAAAKSNDREQEQSREAKRHAEIVPRASIAGRGARRHDLRAEPAALADPVSKAVHATPVPGIRHSRRLPSLPQTVGRSAAARRASGHASRPDLQSHLLAQNCRGAPAPLRAEFHESSVRRGKAPFPSGCESRPATFAPAGSNRSGLWR